jgi:signal transduction histidine kinase
VRWRLTVAFAAVMAVVLAATGLFVYQRQAANLDQAIERALRARAADVAALAQQSDNGLSQARLRGASAANIGLAQVIDASGRVLDRTPGASRAPLLSPSAVAAARRGGSVITDLRLPGKQPVRLLAEPVHAQDETLVIVVGQPLDERNYALSELGGVLLVGGPLALLLASLAGYLLTGAALRPVEMMRRQAARISAADLDQRLPAAGSNDELGRLGRTLNEMLTRIHASVERERTLVSDASHELRTPLTVLRTELELIARDRPAGQAFQTAIGSAIEETGRLSRLAEAMLLLARADDEQLALHNSPIAAEALLDRAADRARSQALAGITITVDAPRELCVLADPDRAAQAIDNLLGNALRHASAAIRLSACGHGPFVELHVTDDGPGFPADFLPHAWERFARADAARTDDGAGLGLAIVRAIALAHGGQAHAANAATGGADVWITLPAAPLAVATGLQTTLDTSYRGE